MNTPKLNLNKFSWILILSLFMFACNTKNENTVMVNGTEIPQLEERSGELARSAEWEKTKQKVAELTEKIKAKPEEVKARLQLATLYMSEARITGNSYYHQASLKLLDGVLAMQPDNFEAITYKSSVAMSLHQFALAKTFAERARSLNPNNAYVYGVLTDANVELGNYAEAIAMSDKMQMLKPSLESYSRASYLREIHGDYPGALEAMKMAVKAGVPGTESGEWARVTLGDIYLNMGNTDSAELQYRTTLAIRPDFPNALIGLAKAAKMGRNFDSAIQYTQQAIRVVSEASYVSLLAELYELKGDQKKAAMIRKDVLTLLEKSEKEMKGNVVMEHNANRELANAYLQNSDFDKALQYAKTDLELRPYNIDANELVAWVLYLKGDYKNSVVYADKMLQTQTMNPNTLYKAGLIYAKSGNKLTGDSYQSKALALNSRIDPAILAR